MDELLQEFIAETRETLEALASELVIWENAPDDRDRLDAIFRFFHTVKGSCGFLNLPRFASLSHAAEDVLAQLRDGSRQPCAALVDAVLAIVDRIAELTEELDAKGSVPDGDDSYLIAALAVEHDRDRDAAGPAQAMGSISLQHQGETPATVRSIRVPLELLDHMMSGVSDMVLARNEVARCLRDGVNDPVTESAFERLSACIADMRDAITKTRMQRIERLFSSLPRLVRDLTSELGKKVTLHTAGNNVELDREMIELIRDPIVHIIRNAIDHGLETPEERLRLGKPEAGRLAVMARQSGNQILIEFADDGRGINLDAVVAKAIRAKIKSAGEAHGLSNAAKLELIFAPGFSTAETVTEISGRGVGMDVVRSNIERIGGAIELENREGQGLKVTMRVPLTLTIIPCLTVRAGGQEFAIPRAAIREILFDSNEQVRIVKIGGAELANIRGESLPHFALENILGLPHQDVAAGGTCARRSVISVTASNELRYAMSVEAVIDHEELVVRPGAPVVMAGGIYAGTTLPDNGRPMLLLDPVGLAARARINERIDDSRHGSDPELARAGPDDDGGSALLFVDIDKCVRAIVLGVVERVEDVESSRLALVGGQVRVQIGDESRPVFGLDTVPADNFVKLLHLSDGSTDVHYAIKDIIDMVRLPRDLAPVAKNPLIAGIALLDGRQVEVIDAHSIFSALAEISNRSRDPGDVPQCSIVGGDDGWISNILAPLVRAAGYRLNIVESLQSDTIGEDDLVFVTDDQPIEATAAGAVVRLVRHPPDKNNADSTNGSGIYRYDRDALMQVLRNGKMVKAAR